MRIRRITAPLTRPLTGLLTRKIAGSGGGPTPPPEFTPYAVNFGTDGAHLSRTTPLDGAVPAAQGIVSVWLRFDTLADFNKMILEVTTDSEPRFTIRYNADLDKFDFVFYSDTGASSIWRQIGTMGDLANFWFNLLVSWDCTSGTPSVRFMINGVDDVAPIIAGTAANADWSVDYINIGTQGGIEPYDGDMAELYVAPGQFLDFDDAANTDKFRLNGIPQYLGDNGQLPTGTVPLIYLRGPAATWGANLGTGGDFVRNGVFIDSTENPDFSVTYLAESQAIFNAFENEATGDRKQAINALVRSLIASGYWDDIDFFYMLAAADEQAAGVNWRMPTGSSLVKEGTVDFTPDDGYVSPGNGNWVGHATPLNALTFFTQNDAHVLFTTKGVGSLSTISEVMGTESGAAGPRYSSNPIGDYALSYMNSASEYNVASPRDEMDGITFILDRRSSLLCSIFVGQTQQQGGDTVSVALPADRLVVGSNGYGGALDLTFQSFGAGASQESRGTDIAALVTAIETYISAITP